MSNDLPSLEHTYAILKKIRRQFICRSNRLLDLCIKKKYASGLVTRAAAWEQAVHIIDGEMESIKCQVRKIKLGIQNTSIN